MGVPLSELLCFALIPGQLNVLDYPLHADILVNAKPLLSALFDNPSTTEVTLQWAHGTMCKVYADAVYDLSLERKWHFTASHAQPHQIRDFQIEDMAVRMEAEAPLLWELVHGMLHHHPIHRDAQDAMQIDEEADYWSEVEDEENGPMGSQDQVGHGRARRRVSHEAIARIVRA